MTPQQLTDALVRAVGRAPRELRAAGLGDWVLGVVQELRPSRRPSPAPDRVLAAVAEASGLPVAALAGGVRSRRATLARRASVCLLRERCGLSLTAIGDLLGGRDHATILYHVRRRETAAGMIAAAERLLEEEGRDV